MAGTDPVDHYYYVDGRQVGELTNNGSHDPSRDDYSGVIETRTMKASTSDLPFRWNSYGPVIAGQFGGSGYDPVSPYSNGMQGHDERYSVREGDTLASIAQQVWGDASLWYMIAEANGLSGAEALVAGTSLIVPDKVTNLHNNGSTFQVYDPNKAFGDLNPTTATTTSAQPPRKANKCGVFGMILLVVIAVAVAVRWSPRARIAALPGIPLAARPVQTLFSSPKFYFPVGALFAVASCRSLGGSLIPPSRSLPGSAAGRRPCL